MTVYVIFDQEVYDMQAFSNKDSALHALKQICKERGYSKSFRKDLINRFDDTYISCEDDYVGVLILSKVEVQE